jgi:hypothetical protein
MYPSVPVSSRRQIQNKKDKVQITAKLNYEIIGVIWRKMSSMHDDALDTCDIATRVAYVTDSWGGKILHLRTGGGIEEKKWCSRSDSDFYLFYHEGQLHAVANSGDHTVLDDNLEVVRTGQLATPTTEGIPFERYGRYLCRHRSGREGYDIYKFEHGHFVEIINQNVGQRYVFCASNGPLYFTETLTQAAKAPHIVYTLGPKGGTIPFTRVYIPHPEHFDRYWSAVASIMCREDGTFIIHSGVRESLPPEKMGIISDGTYLRDLRGSRHIRCMEKSGTQALISEFEHVPLDCYDVIILPPSPQQIRALQAILIPLFIGTDLLPDLILIIAHLCAY